MNHNTSLVILYTGLVWLGLVACKPAPALELVEVPAGWFVMGSNTGRRSNQPAHLVYLDAFAICRTEVTNRALQVEETRFRFEAGFSF